MKRWTAIPATALLVMSAGVANTDSLAAPNVFEVLDESLGIAMLHLDVGPELAGSEGYFTVDGAVVGGTMLAAGSNVVAVPQGTIYSSFGPSLGETWASVDPWHDPGEH